MRLVFGLAVACGIAMAFLACATVAGIDGLAIGECKGGGDCRDASTEPTGDGALPSGDSGVPCPGRPAPPATRVGSATNAFCIDTKEVTSEQYDTFVAASVDPKGQPRECAWNTSFGRYKPPVDDPQAPAIGMDWCDALAYCTWAGKYLCGRAVNGKKTGPVTPETAFDYRTHQWMLACSAEGRLRYPYGGSFSATSCNAGDLDAGSIKAVGTMPDCMGGYQGIYDMIGNVWEWIDGCKAGGKLEVDGGDGGPQSDECAIKGGSYLDKGPTLDCRYDGVGVRRDFQSINVGIRCCSD